MRLFFYYLGGTLIWFLLLALMPATADLTNALMVNYLMLTAGVVCGLLGKTCFERRPWLLLFVPGLPLVLGIFL